MVLYNALYRLLGQAVLRCILGEDMRKLGMAQADSP